MMTTQTMTICVSSDAFIQGQPIPQKYTGEGENTSPPLRWSNVPKGTAQLAVICEDPDAPHGIFTHWVLYSLSPKIVALGEGVEKAPEPFEPAGALQGISSVEKYGYIGPMPPQGHGVHHYHFRLFALDKALNLKPGLTREQLLAAMKGHVIAEGDLIGTYERK